MTGGVCASVFAVPGGDRHGTWFISRVGDHKRTTSSEHLTLLWISLEWPKKLALRLRQTWGTRFLDGFTDFRSESPVIYLGRKAERIRARFIFAHEIAHVMLRTPAAEDAMMRHGQTCLSQEEKLANRIAASLLVPDWVVEDLSEMQPCPRKA